MTNRTQVEAYEQFRALHHDGFVMPNAWDGLSARIFRDAGFKATATSSAALALMLGRPDGRHQVSRAEHLDHARLLIQTGGLPVNGDFEDGYGDTPDDVARTVEAAIDAGLAGIGVEDTSGRPEHPIRDFDESVRRIEAAATAARGRIVLTGRTDNFIQGRPDLDDTIRRLTAFAEAGADVLYAPYPPDMEAVRAIVAAVAPKSVNIVVGPSAGEPTVDELLAVGVRRISLGVSMYMEAMGGAQRASALLKSGNIAAATANGLSFGTATELVTR